MEIENTRGKGETSGQEAGTSGRPLRVYADGSGLCTRSLKAARTSMQWEIHYQSFATDGLAAPVS